MSDGNRQIDERYQQAMVLLERLIDQLRGCSEDERLKLRHDMRELRAMQSKLADGRVEIVVCGEISTGKSALVNALVCDAVRDVDVRGGWTKEVWDVPWDGCGYCVPGFANSQVVLIDTPGLNEVGGGQRAQLAHDAAQRADLILYVTDSDLNESEYSALISLASAHKPIILVFNKMDNYTPDDRHRLMEMLRDERMTDIIAPENVVMTAADPKRVQYVIESADGTSRSEWRNPAADVEQLKMRILDVLHEEGLGLLALNAAMYAADKSDRIAAVRVLMRNESANTIIWRYAGLKGVGVALNPIPIVDTASGLAIDATMVVHLARIYGLEMTKSRADLLVKSILKSAGMVGAGEISFHLVCGALKAFTMGYATAVTALPQGGIAAFGSYIVGKSAKCYFEQGASWGDEGPKTVVARILDQTDKKSVVNRFKDQIKSTLRGNKYAEKVT